MNYYFFSSFSFSFYSWTLLGVILARIRYAQLIPPAAHSLVLFGSTKALGVLTIYSSGEQWGWWPTHMFSESIENGSPFPWPALSTKTSEISKYVESPNECRYPWQLMFCFLIAKLLIQWLWCGRPNYAAQYRKKIQYLKIFLS